MTESERELLSSAISERLRFIYPRLAQRPIYRGQLRKMSRRAKEANRVLDALPKPDRLAVRHHFEDETYKHVMEMDEAYLQGLRDCVRLLHFLEFFHTVSG